MLKDLLSLYSPRYPSVLAVMLQGSRYRAGSYLAKFWGAQNFKLIQSQTQTTNVSSLVVVVLAAGMFLQIATGIALIHLGLRGDLAGGEAFGAAAIIAYPLVWAHLLVVPRLLYMLLWIPLHPKRAGKSLLCTLLERQVKRLRNRHDFKVVAVAGSVGKTSTKLAIAKVLGASEAVLCQEGNYNDRLTVPLVFFNQTLPALWNIFAWKKIWWANQRALRKDYPYRIVVVELGTDGPGQIEQFDYLQPELTVLTAVAEEHMEYFGNLDAVAEEELAVFGFSQQVLVNVDAVPAKYLNGKTFAGYGLSTAADYRVASWHAKELKGTTITLKLRKTPQLKTTLKVIGKQGVMIATAAAAVAQILGFHRPTIKKGLEVVAPFAGRMQVLPGIKQSTIIDDTYNASPVAVAAALDVLYAAKAPQRIAILGNMNELGELSRQAHQRIGRYCDPKKLDLVVTIGPDAKEYLAPAAQKAGCRVESFDSPHEAGEFVKKQLKSKAVVLAKGSQNGVFAEEALKPLLRNLKDAAKLVRQSPSWLKIKQRQFKSS